jgi:hypothetical protein
MPRRNAVLCQHQIGGLQDVVPLDHALRSGDGDRSTSAPLKPCSACRSRTAPTAACAVACGVARIALQHRAGDDKRLAEAAGQLGLVPFRAEHLEEPELRAWAQGAPGMV